MRWLVLLVVAGCLPQPVYRVQRDVRIAHATAPLWSGAPMQGPVEISAGASNLIDARAPRLGPDPTVASEVPSMQLRGELRFRIQNPRLLPEPPDIQLVVIHDQAIASTYRALDPTQAPVDHDTAQSLGLAGRVVLRAPEVPGLSLGLGVELVQWWLPYVEYRSCVAVCDGAPTQERVTGTDTMIMPALQFIPSYRRGALTLFAGLYGTPQARVTRKGTELGATDYDSDITRSGFNVILHAGAEVSFGYVSVLAQIQQDLMVDPASYGPSLGVGLAVHLPESIPLRTK